MQKQKLFEVALVWYQISGSWTDLIMKQFCLTWKLATLKISVMFADNEKWTMNGAFCAVTLIIIKTGKIFILQQSFQIDAEKTENWSPNKVICLYRWSCKIE